MTGQCFSPKPESFQVSTPRNHALNQESPVFDFNERTSYPLLWQFITALPICYTQCQIGFSSCFRSAFVVLRFCVHKITKSDEQRSRNSAYYEKLPDLSTGKEFEVIRTLFVSHHFNKRTEHYHQPLRWTYQQIRLQSEF